VTGPSSRAGLSLVKRSGGSPCASLSSPGRVPQCRALHQRSIFAARFGAVRGTFVAAAPGTVSLLVEKLLGVATAVRDGSGTWEACRLEQRSVQGDWCVTPEPALMWRLRPVMIHAETACVPGARTSFPACPCQFPSLYHDRDRKALGRLARLGVV